MDRIAEAVVTLMLNAAWQTTVIAVAGIGVARLLRRAPAHLRFWLLALTLIAAVAAPVTTILTHDEPLVPRLAPSSAGLHVTGVVEVVAHAMAASARPALNRRAAEALSIIYLAGILLAGTQFLIAASRTRRLLAHSHPFRDGVRIGDDVAAPVTIGATIVLPRSLAESELLPAALAHERAHVRRRDFAMNASLQLLAIPLWFHPAAFLLRRQIAELRELACDEEAARQSSPRAYAAALVRIAAMTLRSDLALGISSTSIERRVASLRHPLTRSHVVTVLAIVAIGAVPLALFAACTRTSITPAIVRPMLIGRWSLVQSQSDFRMMVPHAYDAYTQTIAQDEAGVSVRQHRVAGGQSLDRSWHVITDGRWRAVHGIPGTLGRATWRSDRLILELKGPGAHVENAETRIGSGRLICDGDTERGHYHAVFQRED